MTYGVAVDVGGTFTDVVLTGLEHGRIVVAKTPTTTKNPTAGVFAALDKAIESSGVGRADVRFLDFATTAAVNALLTRNGARVLLLTTRGFGQVLHLARSQTPGPLVGWLNMEKPEPLADLEDTIEIDERTRADGSIERPLDVDALRRAVSTRLEHHEIDAVAVGFLHSYANETHERLAADLISELAPGIAVTTSADVHPEYREYERIVTCVANAFVMPTMQRHLEGFDRELRERGWACSVNVVRSDGGLMSAGEAARRPVATILAGPSGGVAGALTIARLAGLGDVLTLDMGGTSTDVSVCLGSTPQTARETILGDVPLRSPSVDVRSIGAGGGSIAYIPELIQALRVGPQSAGAEPGPACYRRGGVAPTVTDANLLLGRLPTALLAGEMTLDRDAAHEAMASLAAEIGLSVLDTAQGIVDIVNENMAGALRVMSVERGLDPRSFGLVAFGGAGPLHANALAGLLGCFPVLVPAYPGVFSAFGFLTAGHRNTFTRTVIRQLSPATAHEVLAVYDDLALQARAWLASEGVAGAELALSADMRFLRQGYELEVELHEEERTDRLAEILVERFRQRHQQLYGFVAETAVEVVNVRVEARGPSTFVAPPPMEEQVGDGSQATVGRTTIYTDRQWRDAVVYDRSRLTAGDRLPGPGIVTQPDTTTLVLAGFDVVVDRFLNLSIDRVQT